MPDDPIQNAMPDEGDGNVLFASPSLSRRIIHSLQRGEHIDPFMGPEFRFLDRNQSDWEDFFRFLGYKLCRSELGGESFFYLKPDFGLVKAERLSRGATFLGIFLAWHFVTEGVDGQESVPATDLAGRILSNFDFNMLVPVFLPVRGRGRQRAETEQNRDRIIDAIRTFLNELARYRFVELRPSVRAEWRDLQVYRLPGLQRFLEVSRNALLHQGSDAADLLSVVRILWADFGTEPDDTDGAEENE
jgi:hypothetical protein